MIVKTRKQNLFKSVKKTPDKSMRKVKNYAREIIKST